MRLMTAALMAALCAASALPAQDRPMPRPVGQPPAPGAAAAPLAAFTRSDLDALAAPVALYPDALLAQTLVAATFPLQILKADRILAAAGVESPADLAAAIDATAWDPSVTLLASGFPEVIGRMADDIDHTERLGAAVTRQRAGVLDAVQRLRRRAAASGYLASDATRIVARDGDLIVIEPADPNVVVVPRYDPRTAFFDAPSAAPVVVVPGLIFELDVPLIAGGVVAGSALIVEDLFDREGRAGWNRDRRSDDWRDRDVDRWRDEDRTRDRHRNRDRDAHHWRSDDAFGRPEPTWQDRRDPEDGVIYVRPREWADERFEDDPRMDNDRPERGGREPRAARRADDDCGEDARRCD